MSEGLSGSCLCGAVNWTSTAEPMLVGHCHCVDCRKSSGTGHCTHLVIPADAFTVSGEVRIYDRPADSGNMVSRGFCPTCGSAVYSTNSGREGMVFPRASSLDDPDAVTPQMIVYSSRAASWDHMDPDLPAFAEMPEEMPAQLAGDQS